MGHVASHTIDDGLTELEPTVLSALRESAIPDWMRPKRGDGESYLASQRDLARQSVGGAVARFHVYSPRAAYDDEAWSVPKSLAECIESYLQSKTHANHISRLDDGQFFDGVFIVADLDDDGRVRTVSLEATYWD